MLIATKAMTRILTNLILSQDQKINNLRRIIMARLLTREEASNYIGIDPKTFDKVFRSDPNFKRFKLGEHTERYTIKSIEAFIDLKETKLKKI